jgi:hypothetical protein
MKLFKRFFRSRSRPIPDESTIREILGIYNPGEPPVVTTHSWIPIDVLAAHEEAHRTLCEATSLGCCIVTISAATHRANSKEDRLALESALRELIRSCWRVQEGFATVYELAHCYLYYPPSVGQRRENSISYSYRLAAQSVFGRLELLQQATDKPSPTKDVQLMQFRGMALWVAKAAMALQLSDTLSTSPGSPLNALLAVVRRDPPDVRLDRITRMLSTNTSFVHRLIRQQADLAVRFLEDGHKTFRQLDMGIEQIVEEICFNADIPYERSDAIDYMAFLRTLPCDPSGLHIIDARDIPIKDNFDHKNITDIAGPGPMRVSSVVPQAALSASEASQRLTRIITSVFGGTKPLIVCELGSVTRKKTLAWLGMYYRRDDFLSIADDSSDEDEEKVANHIRRLHPNVAGLIAHVPILASADDILAFPSSVDHQTWIWSVSPMFLSTEAGNWDCAALRQHGMIVAPTFGSTFHERPIAAEVKIPELTAFDLASFTALAAHSNPVPSGEEKAIPPGLAMWQYESDTQNADLTSVRLMTLPPHDTYPFASFLQSCVAHSVFYGTVSQGYGFARGLNSEERKKIFSHLRPDDF